MPTTPLVQPVALMLHQEALMPQQLAAMAAAATAGIYDSWQPAAMAAAEVPHHAAPVPHQAAAPVPHHAAPAPVNHYCNHCSVMMPVAAFETSDRLISFHERPWELAGCSPISTQGSSPPSASSSLNRGPYQLIPALPPQPAPQPWIDAQGGGFHFVRDSYVSHWQYQ